MFIIKNSYLNPVNNERLKSRSRSRTRRVTTMLLASNIGFLALVAPAQIFYALSFNPELGMQSPDQFKSFMKRGTIYQCLINTYYAASFVFCFASSSIFRREIKKLLQIPFKTKTKTNRPNNITTDNKNNNNDNNGLNVKYVGPSRKKNLQIDDDNNSSISHIDESLKEKLNQRNDRPSISEDFESNRH